jgi:hypothetical protein
MHDQPRKKVQFSDVWREARDLVWARRGRLALGLTGRDPEGDTLAPGRYRLRLTAHPTGRGVASRRVVPFRIK